MNQTEDRNVTITRQMRSLCRKGQLGELITFLSNNSLSRNVLSEGLKIAIQVGRRQHVIELLNAGCIPDTIHIYAAYYRNFPTIFSLLLEALLSDTQTEPRNVQMNLDFLAFQLFRGLAGPASPKSHNRMKEMILEKGVDLDLRAGFLLQSEFYNANQPMVDYLLQHCDMRLRWYHEFSYQMINFDKNYVHPLYKVGESFAEAKFQPFSNRQVVEEISKYAGKYRWKRLSNRLISDKNYFKNKTYFKWQQLADANRTMSTCLLHQARLWNISSRNKRPSQLFKEFSEACLNGENVRPMYGDDYTDLCGTLIDQLPFWQIFIIKDRPFNIFDLYSIIQEGKECQNPYDRSALPVTDILIRINYLRNILTRDAFHILCTHQDSSLVKDVYIKPIPSPYSIWCAKFREEVLEHLNYPPSADVFFAASDGALDRLIMTLEQMVDPSRNSIYPMWTPNLIRSIWLMVGWKKKTTIIDLFSIFANYNDEHMEMRRFALCSALRYILGNSDDGDDMQVDHTQ